MDMQEVTAESLVRNQLIADINRQGLDEVTPAVDRVIWLDLEEEIIGLFEVTDPKALPRIELLEDINKGLIDGSIRLLEEDTWLAPPIVISNTDSEDAQVVGQRRLKHAKDRFKIVEDTFLVNERKYFTAKTRGDLVRELVETKKISKPTVFEFIRLYFRRGMTVNAFITNHDKCGAPGKVRKPSKKKRGRPPKTENRTKEKPGINIDPETTAKHLISGWKIFRLKKKQSKKEAWESTLGRYFSIGYRIEEGKSEPILPSLDTLPTLDQFIYWGTRGRNKRIDAIRGIKAKEIVLKNRESLGSARSGVSGPGELYQVDATGGLIHLVATKDRGVRIGKAIVYGTIDTYSQLITGWCVVLENASYAAMAIALARSFTCKVAECKRLGIPIIYEEWPADMVCSSVLGDKGTELMGHQSDNATASLRFEFGNTPTGRADWKPYIERIIGDLKQTLADVPGATKGPKQRQALDEAENACLTLDEFERLLVDYLLTFNHTYEVKDHPHEIHLQAEGLELTPINYWNWGRKNRSGIGKRFPKKYVQAALLPKVKVSAQGDGLKFKRLRYSSAKLSEAGVFLRSTGHKRERFLIAYDPRDLSEIWLINKKGEVLERCPLTQKYAHFRGISLWELESIREANTETKIKGQTRAVEKRCGFRERKDAIIRQAKDAKAAAGAKHSKYDDKARKAEQEKRRSDTAWTSQSEGEGLNEAYDDFGYVPPPNYDEEDAA